MRAPAQPEPAANRSSGGELQHLAFHGRAAHVRALFGALSPAERAHYADADVLHQAAKGALARLRAAPPLDDAARLRERDALESIVRMFVARSRERGAYPRELFRTILEWSEELVAASRFHDALSACDLAHDLGVRAYPDIWPWVQLRQAHVRLLLGDAEAAYTQLSATCRRLDRIADRRAVPALLEELGTAALATRRAPAFLQATAARLRAFHTDADERRAAADLMLRVHRTPARLMLDRTLPFADRALWLSQWSCLGAARRVAWRPAARLLESAAAAAAFAGRYGVGRAERPMTGGGARPIDATLITRAMGGIGDFLMMTPALRALKAERPGHRFVLAIPARFFPIFEGNDDVHLLDIDGEVDPAGYRTWFNLTDCPAARVESRTAPAVRANRIELFARGLGIGGVRLARMDRRPRYIVTPQERAWRDRFLAAHGVPRGAGARLVVGVQPHTDETYRNVPHMRAVVRALSAQASVLVFGRLAAEPPSGAADGDAWPDDRPSGIVETGDLELRRAFALASGCDVLVTPDSAFFHLAGALDLPCVGLFGPTDGRVRARDYPRARVIDARRTLACVPCWRNEATACGLTGLRPSACLGDIDPAEVVRTAIEIARLDGRGAPAPGAVRPS